MNDIKELRKKIIELKEEKTKEQNIIEKKYNTLLDSQKEKLKKIIYNKNSSVINDIFKYNLEEIEKLSIQSFHRVYVDDYDVLDMEEYCKKEENTNINPLNFDIEKFTNGDMECGSDYINDVIESLYSGFDCRNTTIIPSNNELFYFTVNLNEMLLGCIISKINADTLRIVTTFENLAYSDDIGNDMTELGRKDIKLTMKFCKKKEN